MGPSRCSMGSMGSMVTSTKRTQDMMSPRQTRLRRAVLEIDYGVIGVEEIKLQWGGPPVRSYLLRHHHRNSSIRRIIVGVVRGTAQGI